MRLTIAITSGRPGANSRPPSFSGPAVRANCTHMTIWVDPVRGIQLKQSLYMPSEDYRTAVYTNIKYNQKVDEKPYQIKTDSKTTFDTH